MNDTNAKAFYGTAYTPERAEKLDKAVKFLDMAFRAALNAEQEAFAS